MPELKQEQRQAVFHDDGNILVSASAGSGKTFVMIERLIRLIAEGKAGVKEILAVTFTEMAASEMKEKLKTALTEKIRLTGDKRLIRELQEVAVADISTLHAFSARLIRAYFYAVSLSPDFRILDEAEAGAIKRQCVDKAFREFYEGGEEWFKTILCRHLDARSDEELKKTIIRMSDAGNVNADGEIYFKKAQSVYTESGIAELLEDYKKELNAKLLRLLDTLNFAQKTFSNLQKDKIVEFINELTACIEKVYYSSDVYAVKEHEGFKLDLPRGVRLTGEIKDVYQSAVSAREEFKELMKSANNGLSDRQKDFEAIAEEREHVLSLFKVVQRYEQLYREAKREENGLDFSDLEHFALEILNDQRIRDEVKNRYKYIFVDEYQDINGAQEAIISALENDNLFMVGDAKQSIYGFRGCRPEIFLNKLERMSKNGQKTVLLNHNFRSSDNVIELVNKVFSYSMTKDYFGMSYKDTSLLRAGGAYGKENPGRVELHLILNPPRQTKELESPRIYDLLEELKNPNDGEILPTPTLIASIIEQELKRDFYDTKQKKIRPVSYGDICILTRNKDNKFVRDIVKTLVGYGVPVVSVVKENVCDHPEIRQLIDVVKLLDCFNQDIPLAGALKSSVGNFTDEELAEIVLKFNADNKKGGFYDAFIHYINTARTPLKDRLMEFYEYFNDMRLISDFTGAFGALKRIILDKNIEQSLFAEQFGALKVKRLNRFLTASVVEGKPLSVKEFLDRVERYPSSFGLSDGAEDDSVKVMTIHASKGLEFPVVIACGLERNANDKEERDEVMFDQDLGFAVKSYNDLERTARETPLRMILRNRMKGNRLKEELRLFYVALTRASYSLHLTFSGTKDARSSAFTGAKRFLDYIPSDIELTEHNIEDLCPTSGALGVKKVLIGQADNQLADNMKRDFSFVYPFAADTVLPLKNSVTNAAYQTTEDTPLVYVLFKGEGPDTEKGNIAHKIMEHYDFGGGSFLSQVESIVDRGMLSKEDIAKIDLSRIEKAVSSPVFENLKGKTLYREKDFIVSIEAGLAFDTQSKEQVLLQGVIDLLAVDGDSAVIIDYKYSSLEINSLKSKYAKQLDLYAYALEKATGIKTKDKILVNLFTGDSAKLDN